MNQTTHIKNVVGLPEIGRYYLVPTIVGARGRLPVIGPEHEDVEHIGVAKRHYHHDWRFMRPRDACGLLAGHAHEARYFGPILCPTPEGQKPLDRRLMCYRDMPTFPTSYARHDDPPATIAWMRRLEEAYADAQIKLDCAVCPHRGLPLNGLPVRDGVVVCPGHGLAWDMTTGRMARRVSATPSPASSSPKEADRA